MSGATLITEALPETNSRAFTSHASARPIRLCHFTTAHSSLKSRSFHRQCLPLAQRGLEVRYVAPFKCMDNKDIGFVTVRCRKSRLLRALANPILLRQLLHQNADLYYFQDPELLPLGLALKTAFCKRVVYDAYEDFPSMARASESVPRPVRALAGKLIEILESVAARTLDGIATADPLTLRRVARTGKSQKLVFHNFPNLDFFPPPLQSSPKKFDLVYRGGISSRAGTFVLLDALQALAKRSRAVRTLLLGYFDGPAAEREIRNRIREFGLESSTEICVRIGHEDMARALSHARVGVCPLQAVPKFLLNLPVKVFEYWACGLPVIASDLPPIRPYFRAANAGLLFEPGNSAGLANSIEWMLDHPEAATQFGENGRAAIVQRFNNQAEIRKLHRFCTRLAARGIPAEESPLNA